MTGYHGGESLWDRNVSQSGVRPGRYLSIQQRFDEWMQTVDGFTSYDEVVIRARDLRARGFRHYGIGALWEAMRYDAAVRLGPNAGFKLNDHFRSRMARLVMDSCPDLADFFEVRSLRA